LIKQDTIQNILNAARIEEVVGDFVSLKKRGINLIGNCPFHQEKTPSFTVSPAKGIYKCFGCGKSGNATRFIMDHENLTFPESLEYLAKKYNIAFESTPMSEEELAASKAKDSLFSINSFAQKFFSDILWNDEEGQAIGLSYFRERNLRDDVIQKFVLGYCPDQENRFTTYALQQGYGIDDLKKLGLTQQQRQGDFFRGRVVFPVLNLSGKVVAFGGRTLKKDKSIAKYYNSPESEIYHKSKVLYGIYQAKQSILKNEFCYLVEGYMDVIALYQGGIENVVASSGTALTADQVRLVKRFTKNIVLLYDGDEAGIKAALRGLEILIEEGMNLKLVLLPDGEDPDSFIQKNGAGEFADYVKANAKDFLRFKMQFALVDAKSDPYKKAAVIREMIEVLAKIPDHFVRSEYVKEFSGIMQISEGMVVSEVNKLLRGDLKKKFDSPNKGDADQLFQQNQEFLEVLQPAEIPTKSEDEQEKHILRVVIEFGDKVMSDDRTVAQFISEEVELALIDNPVLAQLMDYFLQQFQAGTPINTALFTSHIEVNISKTAIDLITFPYDISPNWIKKDIIVRSREDNFERDVRSVVHHFKMKKLLKLIEQNIAKIKVETNPEELIQHHFIHMELSKMKAELGRAAGTVITH
jgi:DNA primase